MAAWATWTGADGGQTRARGAAQQPLRAQRASAHPPKQATHRPASLQNARRDAPASEGGVIRAASRRLWGTLTPVILPPGARATCSHFVCSPPPAPAASLSGL